MISRRAIFSFLAGGAVLIGLPAAAFERQIRLCDLEFAFRDCKLLGGDILLSYGRHEEFGGYLEGIDESPTVGWKTWINGEKYGMFITIDGVPTEKEAAKITEVLQYNLDRSRRKITSRLGRHPYLA